MTTLYGFIMLQSALWWPNTGIAPKVVVGYLQDGTDVTLSADQIDYAKITHLNIAFANPTDADGDLSTPTDIKQLVAQAHKNKVKVLISIGGGFASENQSRRQRYFDLISDPKRSGFVRKLADYLKSNDLDGLDVDLEGPAIGNDYGAFITALSKSLKPRGMLLTAAVSGDNGGDRITADALKCFDLVNVMAYDATGPWRPERPGQHSSMDYAKQTVTYWIGRGVPKAKIVLGVPFYGWGFGDAFNQGGYRYADIVGKYPGSEMLDQVGNTIWYNGIPTIRAKVKYVEDQGLGGIMIWSLNQDAMGPKSLLAAIHDALTVGRPAMKPSTPR